MIVLDVILTLLATASLLWGINYSIVAHMTEDSGEARANFLLSYMFIVITVISLVFVAGNSGGF